MQDALPIVVVVVVLVAAVVGVALLLGSRNAYDRIGRSDLTFDRVDSSVNEESSREQEIAQMLAASNARRAERGRPPLQLSELQGPGLEAEVREAVEARNRRLVARGRPPLDVEAEVKRRLARPDG